MNGLLSEIELMVSFSAANRTSLKHTLNKHNIIFLTGSNGAVVTTLDAINKALTKSNDRKSAPPETPKPDSQTPPAKEPKIQPYLSDIAKIIRNLSPLVPLNRAIWSPDDVAEYLRVAKRTVVDHYSNQPDFPEAIRLPSKGKKWSAKVESHGDIKWAEKKMIGPL